MIRAGDGMKHRPGPRSGPWAWGAGLSAKQLTMPGGDLAPQVSRLDYGKFTSWVSSGSCLT
jgi:hypothetical protein